MQQDRKERFQGNFDLKPTANMSQRNLLGYHELQEENRKLKEALSQQKAYSLGQQNALMELQKELEVTKGQWQRQKTLKEMFINREKETRRELERLIKYSNADTLSKERIASLVRQTTRQKKKKDLHVEYEELKVAHLISEEKITAELQMEMEKVKRLQEEQEKLLEDNKRHETELRSVGQQADALQQELDKQLQQKDILLKYYQELQAILKCNQETFTAELQVEKKEKKLCKEELEGLRVSYREDGLRYETELNNVKRQKDNLQSELQQEVRQKRLLQSQLKQEVQDHAATKSNGWKVINSLKAEQEALRQKMAEERNVLQKDIKEMETRFERELAEMTSLFNQQLSLNLELSTEFKGKTEDQCSQRIPRSWETSDDGPLPHAPAMEPSKQADIFKQIPWMNQETTSDTSTLDVQEVAEFSEEMLQETTRTPSVWKRTRHFLGWKKPEKWKKDKAYHLANHSSWMKTC